MNAPDPRPLWWQTGCVYEVYPRSFADASGDGVGDLAGITSRLDYLAWLGVDAVWIAPFYRSPMRDFGYDVADHTDVDPLFGSLADFDALLAAAHQRGIRVIVDYVPNHTSDQHPWFLASRASRAATKRDWYIWRDARSGPDGQRLPPNNWISMFGGPAWEWDQATGQYYLHTFLTAQPDVNWRNDALRTQMFGVLRFWLDRGVDGFRIDVAQLIGKDPQLRDNPPNPQPELLALFGAWSAQLHLYDQSHPDLHPIYREMRALLDSYPGDRVSIGELHHPEYAAWARFYGENLDELHMPFNFHLLLARWNAADVRAVVDGVEAAVPARGWANWVLGNHDQPRVASRIGRAQARVAMMLILTLRGAPTLYYGDELGMLNGEIAPDGVRDPWGVNEPGMGRDPERTPMPWDGSPNAGFCPADVEPWLPLNADVAVANVAAQRDDPASMLSLTRHLLRLRREQPALAAGAYRPVDGTPEGTFCFLRQATDAGTPSVLVALNLTDAPRTVACPAADRLRALASTCPTLPRLGGDEIELAPNEGLVLEFAAPARPRADD